MYFLVDRVARRTTDESLHDVGLMKNWIKEAVMN